MTNQRVIAEEVIAFKVWVTEARQFVEATFRTGRVYEVKGLRIVLFPISVMAAAVGRDRETITLWERDKRWPKTKWQVPDKRTKRWYSKLQIQEVHRIHWELCKGDYGLARSRHFPFDEFFKRVRECWHRVDAELLAKAKKVA
jgi:hypothetical protein